MPKIHGRHHHPAVQKTRGEQQLAAPRAVPVTLWDGVQGAEEVGAQLARTLHDHLLLEGHLVVRRDVPRVVKGTRTHAVPHSAS